MYWNGLRSKFVWDQNKNSFCTLAKPSWIMSYTCYYIYSFLFWPDLKILMWPNVTIAKLLKHKMSDKDLFFELLVIF